MSPNTDKLAAFVEDEVMFHAVKAHLFSQFDANDLQLVPRAERETAVQAIFDARIRLERGFKNLLKYKKGTATSSTPNINIV